MACNMQSTFRITILIATVLLNLNYAEKIVYNYNGTLGYDEKCMSDEKKDQLLQFKKKELDKELLKNLTEQSCDIGQHLECVKIKYEKVGDGDVQEVSRCRCPDYDTAENEIENAYYDKEKKSCVIKIRGRCTGFISETKRRYNGTGLNDSVDGRPLPTEMPCIENAHCKKEFTSDSDVNANKCICEETFVPRDDNMCHVILKSEWKVSEFTGIALIAFAFALFFVMMIFSDDLEMMERKYGSQEEIVVPSSGFKAKIRRN